MIGWFEENVGEISSGMAVLEKHKIREMKLLSRKRRAR